MIEVTLTHTSGLRDAAEADTPEDALFAARTIYDEMREANPIQGFHRGMVVRFAVDGRSVRVCEGTRP